jgi:hypothetical protein
LSRYLAQGDVLMTTDGDDISIRTTTEMEKYESLRHREFAHTRVYDVNLLERVGLDEELPTILWNIDWGPIECTSMVTQIAMILGCLEMANLAYIEGDVPILGLDHFVHTHILHGEPDHSLSMMYGHKVFRLPNLALRLYYYESLTL